jgi:predicted phage terminase large subunit-like protein
VNISPHPGAQARFLATPADVAFFGGAAGGGKSWTVLLEGMRHVHNPAFRAIYFRRTAPDLRKPKGLWDTSHQVYPHAGGVARDALLEWRFPSGAWLKMGQLEHEKDMYDHQGAEYPLVVFDEATHFSSAQFWYLRSRNRAPKEAGVRPYFRGTCNPDPDSWVLTEFLDPGGYIDEEGYPRPEMAGRVRQFVRDTDTESLVWGDTVEELQAIAGHVFTKHPNIPPRDLAKSFTFVPATLSDNPSMGADYEATLADLPFVERMRLLYGNWRITKSAGNRFKGEWFELVDEVHPGHAVRYWDLASGKKKKSDFTASTLMYAHEDGTYTVTDVVNKQMRPHEVEAALARVAQEDGRDVAIHIEQESGSAGALLIDTYSRGPLRGYSVTAHRVRTEGDKETRSAPASSAAEKRHIRFLRAPWNRLLIAQAEAFPTPGIHDDAINSMFGAFSALQEGEFAWASGSMGR